MDARLCTPQLERGDPFNLGGFFPSSLSDMEGEWDWLRSEDEPKGRPVSIANGTGITVEGDIITRKSIKGEDKLGGVSLDVHLFDGSVNGEAGRLLSPYTDDEAVDHDSLYLTLCSRRQKHGRATKMNDMSFGELFLRDD
ncbi:hypothetical protein BD779DRAFT_42854 [Infundibulicybe gibba]|nr:hypothetical protein BD779DRAFT_42854 [Infundibulicybe gibba]